MYPWICHLWQTFSLTNRNQDLPDPRHMYTLHSSYYGHVFTTALLSYFLLKCSDPNMTLCCWTSNSFLIELCFLSSPAAAAVLRCYLIVSSLSISLSDSHLWPLFMPSGLQCTEFILHLPFLINSRHWYVELQWCWTFLFRLSELKLALSDN